jgi:hypothetical protein
METNCELTVVDIGGDGIALSEDSLEPLPVFGELDESFLLVAKLIFEIEDSRILAECNRGGHSLSLGGSNSDEALIFLSLAVVRRIWTCPVLIKKNWQRMWRRLPFIRIELLIMRGNVQGCKKRDGSHYFNM